MDCNLSRSQKAKANDNQKKVLSQLADYNATKRKYGIYYMILQFISQLYDLGIEPFINQNDKDTFLNMLLIGETMRILHLNRKQHTESEEIEYEYNTSNLYIGMVVPNYKELCRLLEVEPKTGGKSKRLQERDFLRYFDYEKINYSNEYFILDVYSPDEVIPKNGNTRNSLYINQLKVLIALLLVEQAENKHGNKVFKTTFPQLRRLMNIVNINYDEYKDNDFYALRKEYNIQISDSEAEYQKNLFKLQIEEKYKNSIRSALNSLENCDILHYDTYTVICYEDDEDEIKYRQATPDEEMYIHNVKQEAAQQLGYTLSLYASRFRQKEFDDIIRRQFKKDKNWKYIFNGISIISNKKALSTPIKDYTIFKDIDFSVYGVTREFQNQLRYEYNNNLVNALHNKISKSRADKEQKLLKWYKDYWNVKSIDVECEETDTGNRIDDDYLLSVVIPNHKDMQHYTDTCNRYRDLLVDILIKLDKMRE